MARRPAAGWIGRDARAATHLFWAVAIGAVAGAIAAVWSPWQLAVLIGWGTAGAFIVARSWILFFHNDHHGTADHALIEDQSRPATHVALVLSSVGSLIGEVLALIKANQVAGAERVMLTASVAVTVFVSWAVVHTIYTLRYAELYYSGDAGGVDFNSESHEAPDYLDFAYMAFTIGMTYQVSDTSLTRREVRHAALAHAMLSFLFGTVIIATTINIVAGLIK